MLYLSQAIGLPVLDGSKDAIGKIADFIVAVGNRYPPVTGLVVVTDRRRIFLHGAKTISCLPNKLILLCYLSRPSIMEGGYWALPVPRVLSLASSSLSTLTTSMMKWTMWLSGTQCRRSGGSSMGVS